MPNKNTRAVIHNRQAKAEIIPFPVERTRMPSNKPVSHKEQETGKIFFFLGVRYEHKTEEKSSSVQKSNRA